MFSRKTQVCLALSLAAVWSIARPAHADNEMGTATIKGRVTFAGDPPPPKALPAMTGDAACHKQHSKSVADQGTIVHKKSGNAIPYVFVYIKSGVKGKYDPPPTPVTIDQKGCTYHPHVFGMVAGQNLDIKSSDSTAHNIHALAKKSPEFNISQPNMGVIPRKSPFTKPEIIKIKCDVHAWMSSYAGVCAHPFFDVTKSHDDSGAKGDALGTYEIKNVPAGDYEVEFWHETFGKMVQKVSIKDGETKTLDAQMGPNAKKADASDKLREVIIGEDKQLGAVQDK